MIRVAVYAGDITELEVSAIVNAANESLLGGAGVDGAIHEAAGPDLACASQKLAPCPPGNARLTPGFQLRAENVIHAVGPIYRDGKQGEADLLRQTYLAALEIAEKEILETIAFPCISTGAYNYPKAEACNIATKTVVQWQAKHHHPHTVIFCCFEPDDISLYQERLDELGIVYEPVG